MTGTYKLTYPGATVDTLLTTVQNSNLSATHKITRSATLVVAASDSSAKSKAQADYVCDGTNDEVEIQAAITALPTVGGKVYFCEGKYIKGSIAGISVPSNVELEINGTIQLKTNVGDTAVIFVNSDAVNGNSKISIYGNGKLDGNRANQASGTQNGLVFSNVTNSKINIEASGFTGRAFVVSGQHNNVRNRLYPNVDVLENTQKPIQDILQFPSVNIIDPIEPDDGWVASVGTITWDTDVLTTGSASAKLGLTSWNAAKNAWEVVITKTLSSPISIDQNDFVGMLLRLPQIAITLPVVAISLTDGAGSSIGLYRNEDKFESGRACIEDWQFMGGSPSVAVLDVESPIDYTNITSIKITCRVATPESMYIWVDGIFAAKPMYPEGSIIITVDDGYESVIKYMAPMMREYGYVGTSFVNPGLIGQESETTPGKFRMTEAQLDELHNMGWDICNHTNNHTAVSTFPIGQVEEEVLMAKDWLASKGYRDVAFCYPYGGSNTDTMNFTRQYYQISRKIQSTRPLRSLPLAGTIHMYTALELTDTNLAQNKTLVTQTAATGANTIIYMHHVQETSGGAYSISAANFANFLAHVAASGVRVITFSDLLRDLKNRATSKNPKYVTESKGTATITAAATTVEVAHGLAAAPTRVLLSPTTATAGKQYYVSAKAATTFTITIDSAAGADISFDWQAVI